MENTQISNHRKYLLAHILGNSSGMSYDEKMMVVENTLLVAVFLTNFKTMRKIEVKIKITDMNYKNYTIEPDNTGYAPKSMTYGIYKDEELVS